MQSSNWIASVHQLRHTARLWCCTVQLVSKANWCDPNQECNFDPRDECRYQEWSFICWMFFFCVALLDKRVASWSSVSNFSNSATLRCACLLPICLLGMLNDLGCFFLLKIDKYFCLCITYCPRHLHHYFDYHVCVSILRPSVRSCVTKFFFRPINKCY